MAALAVDAVTFLLAALLIASIHRPMQAARDGRSAQGVFADIIEGFRYVWAHRLVRTIALMLFSFNVMLGGVIGQLVVYGSRVLGLDGLAVPVVRRRGRRNHCGGSDRQPNRPALAAGTIVLVVLPINVLGVVGLALAPNMAVAFVALAVLGAASTVMFVNLLALRQRIVPDRLQGRVNATARAVAVSGTPAGALLAGVLVGPLGGVRTVFLVLAGFALLNAVLAFFTPLREREPVG